jgi:hypothetical protein
MIETLLERISALPDQLGQACTQIFYVDHVAGHAVPPPTMEEWVVRQFGAVADVRDQAIVKVVNRLTLESALFNPLRARRPSHSGGGDPALELSIARELAEHDIFRDPLRDTTADVFGRIRGEYCMTASNVAKYDGWHGLVIFDEPHPLRFGAAQVHDYLDVALGWIAAAHAHDPQAIYPIITWNCLPKSGATIMHGHMQVALARGMHYAYVERWRRAAELYRASTGASYYEDLFAVHQALGLSVPQAGATRSFAHLTPARNREIVLMIDQRPTTKNREPRTENREPGNDESRTTHNLQSAICNLQSAIDNGPRTTDQGWLPDLAQAIFSTLRRLIDRQGVRAFNLAIALPPITQPGEDWRDTPIVARIADRGDALTTRNDMGAMELFAAGCIVADPFEVALTLG